MGIFRRRKTTEEVPATTKRAAYAPVTTSHLRYGGLTYAGRHVTTEEALRNAAVAACVRVLKSAVFMLPVDEVITTGTRRQPVEPSPFVRKPSARVSQRAWLAQNMHSFLTAGNIYLDITADPTSGRVHNAESISPDIVRWQTREGVEVPYVDNKERTLWPTGNLLHKPASAFLRPGCIVADSPVELAKQAIGTALAAEEFGARFFGDGGHPSAIVYSEEELDADGANHVKGSIYNAQHGTREVAVLGAGLKYEQIQVDPNDSQFIELLRFEVEQACRFFGCPPTMVYAAVSGQSITYANVSESEMQFLKFSLMPWLVDLEDMWSELIARPHIVRIKSDALLRMDPLNRHKLYDLRLKNQTMTVNEVRDLEDEPRIEGEEFDKPTAPKSSLPAPPPPPKGADDQSD